MEGLQIIACDGSEQGKVAVQDKKAGQYAETGKKNRNDFFFCRQADEHRQKREKENQVPFSICPMKERGALIGLGKLLVEPFQFFCKIRRLCVGDFYAEKETVSSFV